MASQDYENEKAAFHEFYDSSWEAMQAATGAFLAVSKGSVDGTSLSRGKAGAPLLTHHQCLQ
jgi:hypothetical protein